MRGVHCHLKYSTDRRMGKSEAGAFYGGNRMTHWEACEGDNETDPAYS